MPSVISAGTTAGTAIAISGDTTGNLAFQTNGTTTAMTIDTSQRVGVGISTPSFRLDVARGSSGVVMNLQGTDAYDAETGILFSSQRAKISGFLNSGGAIPGTSLRFYTMPDSGSVTEAMRIDSSGNMVFASRSGAGNAGQLQVGTTSSTGANAYGVFTADQNSPYPLGVKGLSSGQGMIGFFDSGNTVVGSVSKSGSNVAYNTSSDYRLKENIAPMTGALAKVQQLKPVTYTWKTDGSAGQGFIAHELQAVVPDCVTGEKDAVNEDGSINPQGIDTSFLVATLTAAIQELKAELDATKAEVAALKQGA